jgi:hypothetical protein
MTPTNSLKAKRKRPAVVIICTIVFAILSLQSLVSVFHGWADTYILIEAALVVTSFVCLLIQGGSRITYYLTSAALAALVFKALDSAVRFRGYVPPLPPDSPFNRIGGYVIVVGICLLIWRFVFGRPSRQFYGFTSPDSSDAA